ncbi:MAG: SipW-dependent-type signal peptide-containing protein [Oscillospiraceae bacterium]|nr:SipW-dependent-type signal peptide-containing protein [Oscillospiraceae bacterium]
MKKKNLLTVIVSLALVLVLGVGATLAYITATDTKVTNTFTFGDIDVTLSEDTPAATGDETITANTKGFSYANVVPGQTLNKAPEVSVTNSVKAYVFVRVSGFGPDVSCDGITYGWTAISGSADAYGNGTYYKVVEAGTAAQNLGTVFEHVTIGNDETASLNDVVIQVAAIQYLGFYDAADAVSAATFAG